MSFAILADDGDWLQVAATGQIVNTFAVGADAFETLIGSEALSRKVMLDLGKVTFLDSSGIGWLLARHKHFKENHGLFVVHSVPPLILKMLNFMGLPKIVHIVDNATTARKLTGAELR